MINSNDCDFIVRVACLSDFNLANHDNPEIYSLNEANVEYFIATQLVLKSLTLLQADFSATSFFFCFCLKFSNYEPVLFVT